MRTPEHLINYALFAAVDVVLRIVTLSDQRPISKHVPSALFMDAFLACDASVVGRNDRFSRTHAAFCTWSGFDGEKIYEALLVSWVWYGFGELVRILYDRLCDIDQSFPPGEPSIAYAEVAEGIAREMDLRIQFRR